MLYAKGTAWINGGAVPRTSAVFPGDLVQTRSDSMASINASGSNVVVLADSLVKFEGSAVSLEHGGLTVATSKGLSTHAGDITVVPASNGWTEFEVKQVRMEPYRSWPKGRRERQRRVEHLHSCPGAASHRRKLRKEKEEKKKRRRAPFPPPAEPFWILRR